MPKHSSVPVHGDIYHHESLVKAIKQVVVVISALGSPEQIADQVKIVAAIKEAGNIKVYINSSNVDDYLVESITRPTADPNAGEVYYRLMTRFMLNQSKYTSDGVLSELSCPLLLLWVGPAKANRIKEFYPKTSLVNLKAGHCPHDEVPELANKALLDWLSGVTLEASPQSL